jgi:tyrosine-protein kinase Etk/Wzc
MPQIAQLKEKSRLLDQNIRSLESTGKIPKPKYLLGLDDYPDLKLEYTRLFLDLEVQKQIYELLYPEYEKARIEEHKDLPTLQVIDKAAPAGFRAKPKRAMLCVTNFLLAVILSVFLSFVFEFIAHRKEKAIRLRDSLLS